MVPWPSCFSGACGFHIRAALQGSRSFFRNVWPIHLNLRHLISILMFSWLVSFYSFSLEMALGQQILQMYLRHWLIKYWNVLWISVLTYHVLHPYNSTDFTHELNILIFVLLWMWVDCQIFQSLEKAPLAFWILMFTSLTAPPSSETLLPKSAQPRGSAKLLT
jgi:hypothetical protein